MNPVVPGKRPGHHQVTSRLWPVLVTLVVLPLGASLLEVWARGRGSETVVIPVHARNDGPQTDDGDPITFAETPVDEDHQKARETVRRGQLAEGLALYAKAAAAHPEAAGLAVEHGFWLLNARKQELALAELRRARTLSPDDPRVALHLGRALRRADDLAGAEAELRRALAIRPGYGSALIALGGTLLDAGKRTEARDVLLEAAGSGSNEDRARASVQLGAALLALDDPNKAEEAFNAAIERAPARAEVRIAIARAWLNVDTRDAALKASSVLATATELAPDLPDVWTTVGRAREAVDDNAGAEEAYARALHLDPGITYARRRLLRLSLAAHRYTKARGHAEQLLADAPEEPEHHFLAGLVAAREGRTDAARSHYKAAIDRAAAEPGERAKKGYPEAWYNLGLLERDADAVDAAVAAYQKALELRPDYNAAQNNLGLALVDAGRLDEAEATYRALLARAPDSVAGFINLGKLMSARKRYPEAVEAYQKALAVRPGYGRALLDLGVAFARMEKLDDAIATYQKLLEANPRSVSGFYNLGLALEDKGDKVGAARAWDSALELDPEHAPSLKRRGLLDSEAGRLDDAARRLNEVLDLRPGDHDARLALADVRRRQGDAAACQREAERVLKEQPLHETATAVRATCHSNQTNPPSPPSPTNPTQPPNDPNDTNEPNDPNDTRSP